MPNEHHGRVDPYIFEIKFSPLEYQAWCSIRMYRQTRYFRPEYPIGKYFADFADPVHKIVIEIDGKQFHKDVEKDRIRQTEIEGMGWYVIRFVASQLYSMVLNSILDKREQGEIDDDEYFDLIEKHKYDCIDCFFSSVEFKELLESRK